MSPIFPSITWSGQKKSRPNLIKISYIPKLNYRHSFLKVWAYIDTHNVIKLSAQQYKSPNSIRVPTVQESQQFKSPNSTRVPKVHECQQYKSPNSTRVPTVEECQQYKSANSTRVPTVQECQQYKIPNSTRVPPVQECQQYKSPREFFAFLVSIYWDRFL